MYSTIIFLKFRTGYLNGHKPPKKKEVDQGRKPRKELEKWTQAVSSGQEYKQEDTADDEPPASSVLPQETEQDNVTLDPWMVEQMDRCIEEAWLEGSEEAFTQILYFIQTENVPVDYQASSLFTTCSNYY